MPLIIKPRTLALLTKVERRRKGASFIVSAIGAFDLADPSGLDSEQALWVMAAQALPPGAVLDPIMPKPRAELLIGGRIKAPQSQGFILEAEVAGLHRRLAVIGDRWWTTGPNGYEPTLPQPLNDLLLGHDRAFGGPGHPANPVGRGFGAAAAVGRGEPVALPNIENPDLLIQAIDNQPAPARFGPLDGLSPERRPLAGTYDQAWAGSIAPALPDDVHPDFFMTAPLDQRFQNYLQGDEPYRLRNFSADHVELVGRLPAMRVRAFVGRGTDSWVELTMKLDTLWLFAGARRGVLVWHGVTGVSDVEGKDVSDVMVAYERMGDPPRPVSHYAEVRRLRTDPETASRHAFSESQLAPPRDPAEDARRQAERVRLAQERAARSAEAMAYMMNREMDLAGIPPALRPPPPRPPEELLLLPTPEELADGDFDLAALLDTIEAKRRAVEKEVAEAAQASAPVTAAMADLRKPDAGAAEVDALLAALTPLTGVDLAASLDGSLGQAHVVPPDLPEGYGVPPEVDAALGKATGLSDWRQAILAGMGGSDEEMLLKAAHARFLDLPEARPLASARDALRSVSALPPIEIPADAVPPAGPPASVPASPIADILNRLAGDDEMRPSETGPLAHMIAEADGKVAAALPNLNPPPGGSAIDAMLEAIGGLGPPPDTRSVADKLAGLKADTASADALLVDAEARLIEGMANVRHSAPQPLYPEEMFSPRVAKRFGDLVLADIRTGVDLRGRDMAGIDLAGADLSGLDLSGAFLERANLAKTRLSGANLSGTVFTGARLAHADLSGADLSEANLANIDGTAVNLSRARLDRTRTMRARLSGAMMTGSLWKDILALELELDGADLSGARLEGVNFIKPQAAGVRFDRAQLSQCQFLQADLTGASLSGAFVDRCAIIALVAPDLKADQADIRGTAFIGDAMLVRADFSGVLASDSSFYGADLTAASFRRAVLDRATLSRAKLAGASFRLASMHRTALDGSEMKDADFIGAQLLEGRLHAADLTRATLRGANLYGANLMDAELIGADLTGANVAKTVLAVETSNV